MKGKRLGEIDDELGNQQLDVGNIDKAPEFEMTEGEFNKFIDKI